jgi:hypothetical protein
MRRMLARIALLAVLSLGFIGVASAAPASAANCNIYASGIFYNGSNLQYTHGSFNCTDVDLVEYTPYDSGTRTTYAGIQDVSTGVFHPVNIPPTLSDTVCGRVGVLINFECDFVGHVNLWGCGPVPQTLYSVSRYRLHRLATETWGDWHFAGSGNQSLNC